MCVPLRTTDEILGALYVDSQSGPGRFSEEDLELLAAIGNHTGVALHRVRLVGELERLLLDTVRAIAATIDAKDGYTHRHSERVATLASRIAAEMGLGAEQQELAELSALLHDVGKIAVPDSILNKPGRLTVGRVRRDAQASGPRRADPRQHQEPARGGRAAGRAIPSREDGTARDIPKGLQRQRDSAARTAARRRGLSRRPDVGSRVSRAEAPRRSRAADRARMRACTSIPTSPRPWSACTRAARCCRVECELGQAGRGADCDGGRTDASMRQRGAKCSDAGGPRTLRRCVSDGGRLVRRRRQAPDQSRSEPPHRFDSIIFTTASPIPAPRSATRRTRSGGTRTILQGLGVGVRVDASTCCSTAL